MSKEDEDVNETDLILPNDEIFTTSARVSVMILLYTHKKIKFSDLQALLRLTPGNLDHHIRKLEEVKYVVSYKKIYLKMPLTIIEITELGKKAAKEYIERFRDILNKISA